MILAVDIIGLGGRLSNCFQVTRSSLFITSFNQEAQSQSHNLGKRHLSWPSFSHVMRSDTGSELSNLTPAGTGEDGFDDF